MNINIYWINKIKFQKVYIKVYNLYTSYMYIFLYIRLYIIRREFELNINVHIYIYNILLKTNEEKKKCGCVWMRENIQMILCMFNDNWIAKMNFSIISIIICINKRWFEKFLEYLLLIYSLQILGKQKEKKK